VANSCDNDLTVEGPAEVLAEFLRFAAGESEFDFNRIIPYPEEFRRQDEAVEAWDREHAGCDWRARPKNGYNSGGYEWCVANWGTRSLAWRAEVEPVIGYDGKLVQLGFSFETDWDPPLPVVKKAAELYPALCFELRYYQGCWDDPGIFCCAAGVVSDESEPYSRN
jgi:hypothetical protein